MQLAAAGLQLWGTRPVTLVVAGLHGKQGHACRPRRHPFPSRRSRSARCGSCTGTSCSGRAWWISGEARWGGRARAGPGLNPRPFSTPQPFCKPQQPCPSLPAALLHSDMLSEVCGLLRDPRQAHMLEGLRRRTSHFLVDEFQVGWRVHLCVPHCALHALWRECRPLHNSLLPGRGPDPPHAPCPPLALVPPADCRIATCSRFTSWCCWLVAVGESRLWEMMIRGGAVGAPAVVQLPLPEPASAAAAAGAQASTQAVSACCGTPHAGVQAPQQAAAPPTSLPPCLQHLSLHGCDPGRVPTVQGRVSPQAACIPLPPLLRLLPLPLRLCRRCACHLVAGLPLPSSDCRQLQRHFS